MLIKNGNIHDGLGHVTVQSLRIQDGLIVEMGQNLAALEGEEVLDATGMEVMPGFVQAISSWGVMGSVTEIRPSSNDNDEKSDPIMPHLDGFYAFNGRGASAQQLSAFGLTAVGVTPTDNNLFSGSIAAFCVEGVNPYKMMLGRDLGMMASVTGNIKRTYGDRRAPTTRMWIFANLAEQLRKANEYKQEEGKPADDKLVALKKVTDGQMPLFVSCDSATAAQHVYDIVSAYPKIRLVLVNGFGLTGEESWIVENKIPVIVRMGHNPMDAAAMELDLKAMAKLMEQGVPVALAGTYSNGFQPREDLLWNSAEMMRVVHNSEQVLSMITSVPAKILGIDDKTGSLEVGKRADIVVWSANPMETYRAKLLRTYQAGQLIYKEGDEKRCM